MARHKKTQKKVFNFLFENLQFQDSAKRTNAFQENSLASNEQIVIDFHKFI